ncbi:MAG: HAMP domain-containing protein [Gammaproteobacteria bacterium]|nr:HAMP domain-containing protein [Gammaproteobacteria bacterium]
MNPSGRQKSRLNRWLFRILPGLALLGALLIALFLISGVQRGAGDAVLDDGYIWVLIVTVLALIILLWAISERIVSLVRNVRAGVPGAQLSARWVRNFLLLSLPPALIVFIFSAYFLSSTIDSWFDVQVDSALQDSLSLGQQFLDTRTLEVRNQLREIADDLSLSREDGEQLRRALLERVRSSGPSELTVMETDGTLVATANINALTGLPERPEDFAILQAAEQGEYAADEPTRDGRRQIRVIQLMPALYPGDSSRLLQAIYPLPPDITDLSNSIENEYFRYQNVRYLRDRLKQSFLLILSLVLLLTVLLAILAALFSARRMVTPLSKLSRATREVAEGDFEQEVASGERDEIGFLVSSFNQMTQALKSASQEAEVSRAELQAQGEYLQTVLSNLSSGVLTLDESGRIITANDACKRILALPGEFAEAGTAPEKRRLEGLAACNPAIGEFADAVLAQVSRGRGEWQQEIKIDRADAPLVLLMRGSRLPLPGEQGHGHVVVFDDVTILNQAQREAAWAEAARRLAHEVKNPLTPIRLATERLHMRLSSKLEGRDADILEKASTTIVAQVEALRKLVDAFGDYAREPELNREAIDLGTLIRDIVALYQQGGVGLEFELDLAPGPAGLRADSGRLRQLLHNLIRNAAEAGDGGSASLTISSRPLSEGARRWLRLDLEDNGPGFPSMVLENPFEPYVTNKSKGSGLGLAICRKIVAEHDGRITLENRRAGGARVTILLPLDRG